MSMDQLKNVLSILVPAILSAIAGKWGWSPEAVTSLSTSIVNFVAAAVTLGSAAVTLYSIVWTLLHNGSKKLIARTASLPEVRAVVVPAAVEASDPALIEHPKVLNTQAAARLNGTG